MHDWHSHTIYSDGVHTPEEIVYNAYKNGLRTIAITDHHKAFFMDSPNYKDFEHYFSAIIKLKEKYKGKIDALAGLEINVNFNTERDKRRIPIEKVNKLDFVIFERVDGLAAAEGKNKCNLSFKDIGYFAEKITCKKGICHTDLLTLAKLHDQGKGLEYGLDYVISIFKKYNLFYEINIQRHYFYFDYIIRHWNDKDVVMLFNKLRENNIEIKASTDTHEISSYFNLPRLKVANDIACGNICPGETPAPKLPLMWFKY